MAARRRPTKTKGPLRLINDAASFRRAIHSTGDLARACNTYRGAIAQEAIPDIVRNLGSVNIYRNLLAPSPFPRSYDQIKPGKFLSRADGQIEALWTASILALFESELADYVGLRDRYQHHVTIGEYSNAEGCLSEVEARFGLSTWSIVSRILLLQLQQGTPSQKEYLESVLNTQGINPVIALMSFFASFRAEPNVSVVEIARELAQMAQHNLSNDLKEYCRYHANPLTLSEVTEPWACVGLENNSPIIDRFETFVDMATLAVIRSDNSDSEYLRLALSQLSNIPDSRIGNLVSALGQKPSSAWIDEKFLRVLDAYSVGDYQAAYSSMLEQFRTSSSAAAYWEIAVRTEIREGLEPFAFPENSILQRALTELRGLSNLTGVISRARTSLQKVALLCKGHPAEKFIPAFLDRTIDAPIAEHARESQAIWALSSPANNPMHMKIWSDAFPHVLNEVVARDSSHSATMYLYHYAVCADEDAPTPEAIPPARLSLFQGYRAFNSDNFFEARKHLEKSIALSDGVDGLRRSTALYATLRRLGEVDVALSLFCDLYMNAESALSVIPLESLAAWVSESVASPSTALHRSIVYHACSVHFGASYDYKLSDAFEDTLDFFGVCRPTELLRIAQEEGPEAKKLIYFLRNVCTVRRLEDSTEFENYDQVEAERIRLLQGLQEIDAERRPEYAAEIRSITQAAEIARLKAEYERNKIYANESGILQSIVDELSDSYLRYCELATKPDLERSVEGIEKRIKQLLRNPANPALEMQTLRLPSTERVGLFNSMLTLLTNAFVLSPHHGLQTYLSTRILHGALEGELRASFAVNDLLFSGADTQGLATAWQARLNLNQREWFHFELALNRFDKRVSELIGQLKNELIRVRMKEAPNGLFVFEATNDELVELQASVSAATSYDDFVASLVAFLWGQVENSLTVIRAELNGPFARRVESAVDALLKSVVTNVDQSRVREFVDAVARARTEFALQLERVVSWFARAGSPPTEPYSIETVVGVATAITNNCWPKKVIDPTVEVASPLQLKGDTLIPLIEVLMNCFQNANQHGSVGGGAPEVRVVVSRQAKDVRFVVSNSLSFDVKVPELKQELERRIADSLQSSNSPLVAKEGGTGFRKMQRALSVDSIGHSLSATVSDECWVDISFTLLADRVIYEDPAS